MPIKFYLQNQVLNGPLFADHVLKHETRAAIWIHKILFWDFQNSKLNFVTANGMQKLIWRSVF